jgi:DNA polymerase-4
MSDHQRWIIHVDLDAFFPSVEELLHPELRGKPIIVGGDPRYRGVVSSASYAARAYGVRSAMPMSQALRLCPQAVVISPRHGRYGAYSRRVMSILREYTPAFEQVSIDEAFLDVTGCELLWGPVEPLGRRIQQRVWDEQHLPVSLGIASSKLVAKVACDLGKPHGLVIVPPGQERQFLAPLPIGKLWGVGQVTAERLQARGIETIGDLAAWDEQRLAGAVGEVGRGLYDAARGIDHRMVSDGREQRSISQERTFAQDEGDPATIRRLLLSIADDLAARLRQGHIVAQTVRIKLRYPDFTTLTRQQRLDQPTDQAGLIHQVGLKLLSGNWQDGQPLRLMGLAVAGLIDSGGYQLNLFAHDDQQNIRLDRAVDEIRLRFGRQAITRASLLRTPDEDEQEEPPADNRLNQPQGPARDSR